jgi:hypothetical protein
MRRDAARLVRSECGELLSKLVRDTLGGVMQRSSCQHNSKEKILYWQLQQRQVIYVGVVCIASNTYLCGNADPIAPHALLP